MFRKELKLAIVVWLACVLRVFVMPVRWFFQSAECRFQTYLAEDQAWNTLADGWADEAISARVHREHRNRWERFINWSFSDQDHCAKAYISEMNGDQNAPIYRRRNKHAYRIQ